MSARNLDTNSDNLFSDPLDRDLSLALNSSEGEMVFVSADTGLSLRTQEIVTTNITIENEETVLNAIVDWAERREPSYVCLANTHMIIESYKDPTFNQIINNAKIVAPDGKPLTLTLRLLYGIRQPRIAGPDLMLGLLREAEQRGLSVFFVGSTDEVLCKIVQRIEHEYPNLIIAGTLSPPFANLEDQDNNIILDCIEETDAQIVLVSLGCPKQEKWMSANIGKVRGVMVGIGWGFTVYAGMQKRAPQWMQDLCLEWLYRLSLEPTRLFTRYLITNTLYLYLVGKTFLASEIRNKSLFSRFRKVPAKIRVIIQHRRRSDKPVLDPEVVKAK